MTATLSPPVPQANPAKHKSLATPEYAFAYQLECLLTTLDEMKAARRSQLEISRYEGIIAIAAAAADKFGYLDAAREHGLKKAAARIVRFVAESGERKGKARRLSR